MTYIQFLGLKYKSTSFVGRKFNFFKYEILINLNVSSINDFYLTG